MTRVLTAVAVVVTVAAAIAPPPVLAQQAKPARTAPQGPAKVRFPADFPKLVDAEWRFPIGGFGGVARGAPITRAPVIFVHGNTVDHTDWYPVRDNFRRAGWTDQELWALSYNGLGSSNGNALLTPNPEAQAERREMGHDGMARVTENEVNVPDLHAFVLAVRSYTGSRRFHLVGHSLGVTVARRMLKVHTELRGDLVSFVGIAGGNHGTSLCPPGSEYRVVSCDEIAAGTPWLAALNGPGGSDETYGATRWLTVYDGSGAADPAFAGPYAQSPLLRGAENRQFPGTYHNDLRVDSAIVSQYRTFIETADRAAGGAGPQGGTGAGAAPAPGGASSPAPAPPRRAPGRDTLPATGAGVGAAPAGAALVGLLLALRRVVPPSGRRRPPSRTRRGSR